MPKPKPRYVPFERFPRSFRNEVARLVAERQDISLFSTHSWTNSIRHASAGSIMRRLHRAADALVRAGVQIEDIDSLDFLTCPPSFEKILHFCNNDRGNLPSLDNWYLARCLRSVGKKWVRQSTAEQDALEELHVTILANPTGTMGRTYADLLEQFDDESALYRLAGAPGRIFRQVRTEKWQTGHTLARAQSALALDVMINAAPTFDPFTRLSFDRHFELTAPNEWGALLLDRSETPSGERLKCDLPPEVVRRLLAYRDIIYPAVSGRPANYLFALKDGRLKSRTQVRLLIQNAALKYADVRVTPQMFRALAGMLMIRAGKSVEEIARALGCKSTQALSAQFEDIARDRDAAEYAGSIRTPVTMPASTYES